MDVDFKNKSNSELLKIIHSKDELILKLEKEINNLKEQLNLNRYKKFGASSEKSEPKEQQVFNDAPRNVTLKKKIGRKPISSDLPRKEIIYDLNDKHCKCGECLTEIGYESSEQADIIPMKIYVKKHMRKKYICRKCNKKIITAKMPKQPIPKSIAGPGLLAHTITLKYQDHLPLYRQESVLNRIGIDIPRATLANWIISVSKLLKPMYTLMQNHIVSHDVAYSDETTVQVLKEANKRAQSNSYMWLFAGGGDKFCFIYKYNKSRSHIVPLEIFEKFKGYLHSDGFTGYDSLAAKADITLVGCWYHFRRKLVEVTKIVKKDGVATEILNKIVLLSKIEQENKKLKINQVKENRLNKSKPIIDEIKNIIDVSIKKTPPGSLLYKSLNYATNQWNKLLTFLEDGRLDISNNLSERAIKPFVIGRKNWLFSNSIAGANASSIIYSFVETCKHHGIEPYFWFKYVLEQINNIEKDKIHTLLPFNINKSLLDTIENYNSS